jgi:DNA-binding transcriptional ArsR family regulator
MDISTTVSALKALSHESRLSAFRALVQAGAQGLAVGELRELLDLPPATLSAHLNVLRGADLIDEVREGRVIRLRANYAQMNALLAFLTESCCGGQDCSPNARGPAP